MKTPLTLQRLFLGLNGMAIEGKKLDICVVPEYDESGKAIGTKWNLKIDNTIDTDNEEIEIKDFLAGYRIDNEDYNVIMKFYDASGKFPRQIADRISSIQGTRKKKIRKTNESAFFQLLTIIRDYYDYLDEDVISILQNVKIIKAKCNISYPLLIKIPDNIQTNDDLLNHFYLLTLLNSKTLKDYKNKFTTEDSHPEKVDVIEKLLNIFQSENVFDELKDYMNDGFIDEVKNDITLRNKIRYWKKVLTLKNEKRYWISNHIFNNSIIPFKELMADLTGISISAKVNNNSSNNKISSDKISSDNNSSNNDFNNTNSSILDNLVNSAFGFNFNS